MQQLCQTKLRVDKFVAKVYYSKFQYADGRRALPVEVCLRVAKSCSRTYVFVVYKMNCEISDITTA